MEEKICSFIGHRNMKTAKLYAVAFAEIMKAVELGCRIFYFGGYGVFNDLCYGIVTKIKNEKPELELRRVYCFSEDRHMRDFRPDGYEDVLYLMPSLEGWRKRVHDRNRAMINQSDLVIFGLKKKIGRTYTAYKYAKKKKDKKIVNLYEA